MAMETSAKGTIAIIGAGHIGFALAEGLVRSGIRPSQIIVSVRSSSKANRLKKKGIHTVSDNATAAKKAEWVFLAVKPASIPEALADIARVVRGKVVISLAAIVTHASLRKMLQDSGATIVRVMPNIAIAFGEGVLGFYAPRMTASKKTALKKILSRIGLVIEVAREHELNILSLVSACGPGIVAFLIEMFDTYASKSGLSERTTRSAVLQMFKGTLAYMEQSGAASSALMASVATKGGVTEAILAGLTKEKFRERFVRAMAYGAAKLKKRRRR